MGKKLSTEELIHIVNSSVEDMLENNEKINYFTVSERTGLSRPFLYNHSETRELIELYRTITNENKYQTLCTKLKEENKNLLTRIESYDKQILERLLH